MDPARPPTTKAPRARDREKGFAIVIALLVLVAITLPAFGLMVASQRHLNALSSDVSRTLAIYSADAAAVQGAIWLESRNALGPPERVNQLGISDPDEDAYWAIRNFGDIGDSDEATADDFLSITPDLTRDSGTPSSTSGWFRVSSVPNSSKYMNRAPGEEAGTGLQNLFVVEGLGTHTRSTVNVRVTYAQVFGNAGYE